MEIEPVRWEGNSLFVLDQRFLPEKEDWLECKTWKDVAEAIRNMAVRGAPLIGIAAAYGLALAQRQNENVKFAYEELLKTRPTGVNLMFALERTIHSSDFLEEAKKIHREERERNEKIGKHGVTLLKRRGNIMTLCNTGSLATAGIGTALGVIRTAFRMGMLNEAIVLETRPRLQGAKLTAWELHKDEIPFRIITDGAAGYYMKTKSAELIVTGADCIAANGDTANKIGTYALAIQASYHDIPFVVAAPSSTIDSKKRSGDEIPIEERGVEEITDILHCSKISGNVWNPAFDVTPGHLISHIVTENGIYSHPYDFRGVCSTQSV